MADVRYRANLSTPSFPVDPLTFGQTVIVKGQDQNYTPNLVSKLDADKDAGIPQVYYIANALPTEQGYRSVGFTYTVDACPGTPYFAFPVRSADQSTTLIHTREGYLYEKREDASPQFRYVGTFIGTLTFATVSGTTYINIAGTGCFAYNFTTEVLDPVVLQGLDPAFILGIVGVGGYLLAWSTDSIVWSSILDATDFVPSLDTGAGIASVEGARGAITYCVANTQGVFVFTAENCVAASLSNNARYPFNFKEVVGSSGITDIQAVTFEGNQNTAYAYTTAGFQQVTQTSAKPVWPDLTDSAAVSPVWDENTVVDQNVGLDRALVGAKLTVASARYICISIQSGTITVLSQTYPKYRDIWVYDLALLRWGRIVVDHLEVFSDADAKFSIIALNGQVITCDNSNTPAESSYIQRAEAIIVLGKYQYTRQRFLTLQQVELDNLYKVTNATVDSYPTVWTLAADGASWEATTRRGENTYLTRKTALNHSIMVKGNFHLNTAVLTFNNHGGR